MHIVLATGIFPPDIGGPATYVFNLARELRTRGVTVTVISYGPKDSRETLPGNVQVIRVSKDGGSPLRWRRYAKALREVGEEADIVYAFSSVSAGVPLTLSRLKHPRKILRLGGDFLWERYTDRGGELGLRAWYEKGPWFQSSMNGLLRHFDHIVFSTEFQERLYQKFYVRLPLHSVIENALPDGEPVLHTMHNPFKLLFLGRFVAFKNLKALIESLQEMPAATLSLIGSGPLRQTLETVAQDVGVADRVSFHTPVSGEEKDRVLREHDLLVLPSHTEISPNAALEARAAGLPVLLTEETGLSRTLSEGIIQRPLRTPREIAQAITDAREQYGQFAEKASSILPKRGWGEVTEEHLSLFRTLL